MADPRVVRYQSAIASSYNAIAMIQVQLGRSAEAVRTFEQFRDRMQAILADDPRNYDARIWLSSALHNLGEAQVELGRPAEAVRTFQGAIEQKHLIQAAGHDFKPIRRAPGHHYQGLAGAQLALGRPAEAAATLLEHQDLFAGDPAELYDLACGLSLCIPIVGKGRGELTAEQRAERQTYGDRAMDALRRAVAAGFHDAAHMSKGPRPAPAPPPRRFPGPRG